MLCPHHCSSSSGGVPDPVWSHSGRKHVAMLQLILILLVALCALVILLHRCLQIITPFTIYFNARFIYQRWELWRLLTNFMFFGSLGGH